MVVNLLWQMTSAPFQNTPDEWISRLPLQSFSHYFSVPTPGSIDIMVGSQYYICLLLSSVPEHVYDYCWLSNPSSVFGFCVTLVDLLLLCCWSKAFVWLLLITKPIISFWFFFWCSLICYCCVVDLQPFVWLLLIIKPILIFWFLFYTRWIVTVVFLI